MTSSLGPFDVITTALWQAKNGAFILSFGQNRNANVIFMSVEIVIWMFIYNFAECKARARRLLLVIGGPYGFSKEVYDRADSLISFSRMTFSHQMVRLFLAEQVYRACTIIKGEPYHHE